MNAHNALSLLRHSPYRIPDPGNSGEIYVDRQFASCGLTTTTTETRTLPIPAFLDSEVLIFLETDGGTCTLTVTSGYNVAGSTSLVFNDAGDWALLRAIDVGGNLRWRLVAPAEFNETLTADVISERTAAAGVTVDGVLLKDGGVLGTAQIGYTVGGGGTVTQATSKSTGVTLNKPSGLITMHNESLAAGAEVTFTLTNSFINVNDVVVVCHSSGGTAGAYAAFANGIGSGGCNVTVTNLSAGALGEAIVLTFVVLRGSSS